MKLLYCQECGDIIAPWSAANVVRYCNCRAHAVWWVNPDSGVLRVCRVYPPAVMTNMPEAERGMPCGNPRAWVLGITNLLLHFDRERTPDAQEVQDLIGQHPDSYIFKQTRSLIIRIRPGQSGDTGWAPLPEGSPA